MAWYNNASDAANTVTSNPGAVVGTVVAGPFGGLVGGAYDWIKKGGLNGMKMPKAAGYNPDPAAFQDPRGQANRDAYAAGAAGAGGRGDMGFRADQAGLVSTLQNAIAGNGPSVAENQLRASTDRNMAQAASMGASGATSVNPALAARAVSNARAGISAGASRDAATLRAQEQIAARGQLGDVLQGARGQDMQQTAINDELVKYYTGLGFANDQAQYQAQMALEQLRVQEALGQQGLNQQAAAGDRNFWAQILGAGMQAGGQAGAAALTSDERAKTAVQPGSKEIQAFLDSLSAKGYVYKPGVAGTPGAPAGRHVGVMAQDLEKTPAGAGMVRNTPAGKMVDPGQAAGAALAASADLNSRLKRLEAGGAGGATPTKAPASAASAAPTLGRRALDFILGRDKRAPVNAGVGA